MNLQVEESIGPHGDVEPVAFMLGDQRVDVIEVIDRWLSQDYGYYKIQAGDSNMYILRHDEPSGEWELTLFQASRPQQ